MNTVVLDVRYNLLDIISLVLAEKIILPLGSKAWQAYGPLSPGWTFGINSSPLFSYELAGKFCPSVLTHCILNSEGPKRKL